MARYNQRWRVTPSCNLYLLIHDYEDLFWLADRILMERKEPTTIEEDTLDRAFVSAMIGMVFEVHELFDRPARKTSVTYSGITETQFEHLPTVAKLPLGALDNMIDEQMRQQLRYDSELKKQYVDKDFPCYANGLTCTQWQTHMDYPKEKRKESWERCGKLLQRLTTDDLREFTHKCVIDRMSLAAWAAMDGERHEG